MRGGMAGWGGQELMRWRSFSADSAMDVLDQPSCGRNPSDSSGAEPQRESESFFLLPQSILGVGKAHVGEGGRTTRLSPSPSLPPPAFSPPHPVISPTSLYLPASSSLFFLYIFVFLIACLTTSSSLFHTLAYGIRPMLVVTLRVPRAGAVPQSSPLPTPSLTPPSDSKDAKSLAQDGQPREIPRPTTPSEPKRRHRKSVASTALASRQTTAKPATGHKRSRQSLPIPITARIVSAAQREGPTLPRISSPTADEEFGLPRVPRMGMGEGHSSPPESDVRAEGQLIIDEARRFRERKRQRGMNGDDEFGGERPLRALYGSGSYPTPITAAHDHPSLAYTTAGPSSYSVQPPTHRTPPNALVRPLADPSSDGEAPIPHEGERPTVILAPNGNGQQPRDDAERAHQDGLDGLAAELETDAAGFVGNVKVSGSWCREALC